MGLPTTWSILCLVHLYWIDFAQRTPSGRLTKSQILDYSICGDDAIIIGGKVALDIYNHAIEACGGVLSEGKHFRSPLGRGVFLEILVTYKGKQEKHWRLQRLGYSPTDKIMNFNSYKLSKAISLRALVSPNAGLHIGARQQVAVDLSSEIAAGAIVDSLIGAGSDPIRVWAVQQTLHRPHLERMRLAGVSAVVPRCLGGAGFITRKGWETSIQSVAPKSLRKAIAVILSNRSKVLGPGSFNRLWKLNSGSLANQIAEEDAESLLGRVKHARMNRTPKPGSSGSPWYLCGTLDKFIEDNTEMSRRRLALMLADDSNNYPSKGPGAYGKRIRAQTKRLSDSWLGVSPIKGKVIDLVKRQRDLEATTLVWLPGTEDPVHKGVFGLPWLSGHGSRAGLRQTANDVIVFSPTQVG